MGYSLSQRGLSSSVMRDVHGKKLVPGNDVISCLLRVVANHDDAGDLIASETEEEIFRLLGERYRVRPRFMYLRPILPGVPWQEPHERVRA